MEIDLFPIYIVFILVFINRLKEPSQLCYCTILCNNAHDGVIMTKLSRCLKFHYTKRFYYNVLIRFYTFKRLKPFYLKNTELRKVIINVLFERLVSTIELSFSSSQYSCNTSQDTTLIGKIGKI